MLSDFRCFASFSWFFWIALVDPQLSLAVNIINRDAGNHQLGSAAESLLPGTTKLSFKNRSVKITAEAAR